MFRKALLDRTSISGLVARAHAKSFEREAAPDPSGGLASSPLGAQKLFPDTALSCSDGRSHASQIAKSKRMDTGSFVLDAGFLDAPQGISPFTIKTKLDQVLADVGAGVDVINTAGAVLRVQYDGKFAQNTQQNSVSLKGSVPF